MRAGEARPRCATGGSCVAAGGARRCSNKKLYVHLWADLGRTRPLTHRTWREPTFTPPPSPSCPDLFRASPPAGAARRWTNMWMAGTSPAMTWQEVPRKRIRTSQTPHQPGSGSLGRRRGPRLATRPTTGSPYSDECEGFGAAHGRPARHRRRHQRHRHRPGRGGARPRRAAVRAGRSGRAHLVGQHQADPRRASLPGAPRLPTCAPLPARARGAPAQRPAHHLADALRAPASRRAAPLVDDPAGPLSLRPPRRARPAAAVREHRPRPARERARVAGPLSPGLRVLGLLGAGFAAGGI